MDTLPTIKEIKDEIRAGLELAEKATLEPWEMYKDGEIMGAEDDSAIRVCVADTAEDQTFIATSRTLCPAQGRALLKEIESYEWHSKNANGELSRFCKRRLEAIRREWKGGQQ